MSLDDRSLREHLDRRANTGLTNPDDLAEAVIAGLPKSGRAPWWRPLVRGGQALAVATAAVAVILVAQLLAPRFGAGPGTSAAISPETTPGTATPSASDVGTGPRLIDIAFSTNAVTLSGFETADINVTATLEGDVVEFGQMDGSRTPLVCLERADATDPLDPHSYKLARTMLRTDGTNQWVASFRLTAGDNGRWQATCLIAFDQAGHELNLNPAVAGISPLLDITGTHAPLLTMEFKPTPAEVGQPLEVFGQVTDEDTGDPYAGVVVTIGRDNVCAEGGAGETVTTNSGGSYTFAIPAADEFPVCTWITDLAGIFPGVHAQDPIAVYGMLFAHPTEP